MHKVALWLAEQGTQVLLFGGGGREAALLERWTKDHQNISLAPERFDLQFQAVAALDVMISMDSANMHFASALGVPYCLYGEPRIPKPDFTGTDNLSTGPFNCLWIAAVFDLRSR